MDNPAPQIIYKLAMPEPHTHYFEVSIQISGLEPAKSNSFLDFVMPVWTPGSYLDS